MKKNVIIIAEAGVNHNGSVEQAKKLIDAAAEAKVDYVKFQTFKAENLVTASAETAEYQKANDGATNQLEMLKRLQLSPSEHYELIDYCAKKGVKFLSTAFDLESLDFLDTLHLDLCKIPSGELTNFPYLRRVAQMKRPILLSTGMSMEADIVGAVEVLVDYGAHPEQIILLQCNTQYPTPMRDVNLLAMKELHKHFGLQIGYSDHTLGIEAPIAAVALGAVVIEKHFTLDKTQAGPDHLASLDPNELKQMVAAIRNVELALGSPRKKVSSSESDNRKVARKSIVAKTAITAGELFSEENLTTKRPGSGITPMRWLDLIGKKATRNYNPDELIEL